MNIKPPLFSNELETIDLMLSLTIKIYPSLQKDCISSINGSIPRSNITIQLANKQRK